MSRDLYRNKLITNHLLFRPKRQFLGVAGDDLETVRPRKFVFGSFFTALKTFYRGLMDRQSYRRLDSSAMVIPIVDLADLGSFIFIDFNDWLVFFFERPL